jgi:hypothetical protein
MRQSSNASSRKAAKKPPPAAAGRAIAGPLPLLLLAKRGRVVLATGLLHVLMLRLHVDSHRETVKAQ